MRIIAIGFNIGGPNTKHDLVAVSDWTKKVIIRCLELGLRYALARYVRVLRFIPILAAVAFCYLSQALAIAADKPLNILILYLSENCSAHHG